MRASTIAGQEAGWDNQPVKRLHLGTQPVNTALTTRFTCKLRAGTYRFSVQAIDAAGNTQAGAASQRLTVRPALGS